jgi:hypothetical protein
MFRLIAPLCVLAGVLAIACTSGPLAPTCPRPNYCQCKADENCEPECGSLCVVGCTNIKGSCTAKVGDSSNVACDGARRCDVTCRGSCVVTCTQGGSCAVHCADPKTCILQCDDPAGAITCPDGVRKTCRLAC